MKLIFSKNSSNEINVQLQKGTIIENFTYIEMINQLLVDNNFSEVDFGNLSETEKAKINSMLEKITDVFKEEEETVN
jgi:hypothetical protein